MVFGAQGGNIIPALYFWERGFADASLRYAEAECRGEIDGMSACIVEWVLAQRDDGVERGIGYREILAPQRQFPMLRKLVSNMFEL